IDDLEGPEYSAYLWYTVPAKENDSGTVNQDLVVESPSGGHAVHAMGSGYTAGLSVSRTTDDVGLCFRSEAGGLKFRANSEKARDLIVRVRLKANTPPSEGGTCEYTEQTCSRNMGECCYDYHASKVRLSSGW